MKKIYFASLAYLIVGLAAGVFYREFTYTIQQTVERWGIQNVSPSVAALYKQQGSGLTRDHLCDKVWYQWGNQTSHCCACHRTFTSLVAFDRHQRVGNGTLTCLDPLIEVDTKGRLVFESVGLRFPDHETVPTHWAIVNYSKPRVVVNPSVGVAC